jgi:hypothetical protein
MAASDQSRAQVADRESAGLARAQLATDALLSSRVIVSRMIRAWSWPRRADASIAGAARQDGNPMDRGVVGRAHGCVHSVEWTRRAAEAAECANVVSGPAALVRRKLTMLSTGEGP